MNGERDRKIEEHQREDAADCRNEHENHREREHLAAEKGVAATGQCHEPLERIVLQLSVERAHCREDRRERQSQPEERRGDVGVARDLRPDHEAFQENEHGDEGHRSDNAVGLSSLRAELACGDESDPV